MQRAPCCITMPACHRRGPSLTLQPWPRYKLAARRGGNVAEDDWLTQTTPRGGGRGPAIFNIYHGGLLVSKTVVDSRHVRWRHRAAGRGPIVVGRRSASGPCLSTVRISLTPPHIVICREVMGSLQSVIFCHNAHHSTVSLSYQQLSGTVAQSLLVMIRPAQHVLVRCCWYKMIKWGVWL